MTTELIVYDEMCRAIAAAHGVDEVKDIRDKALEIEIYSRQARNIENEKRAIEIRIRAERRCGELLRKMEKAKPKGSNQHQDRSPVARDLPTPADLGISHTQSFRCQKLAECASGAPRPPEIRPFDRYSLVVNEIPTNHNPRFAPVIHPTLETGVEAFIIAGRALAGAIGPAMWLVGPVRD